MSEIRVIYRRESDGWWLAQNAPNGLELCPFKVSDVTGIPGAEVFTPTEDRPKSNHHGYPGSGNAWA